MAIVDNNILSALAKIDRLPLLAYLFEDVLVGPEVVHELRDERVAGFAFVDRIEAVRTVREQPKHGWLRTATPTDEEHQRSEDLLDHGLAPADAACIALASSRGVPLVTDDGYLAEVAEERGVDVVDLETLLLAAALANRFEGAKDAREVLDALRREDHYVFSDGFPDRLLDTVHRADSNRT